MNIKQYIAYAKKVLNEDAGSEGMVYMIKAKSGLKAYEDNIVKVDEVETKNGEIQARVQFAFPHDYGYALNVLQSIFDNIEIMSLSLTY